MKFGSGENLGGAEVLNAHIECDSVLDINRLISLNDMWDDGIIIKRLGTARNREEIAQLNREERPGRRYFQ